jgi:hypothetical protein
MYVCLFGNLIVISVYIARRGYHCVEHIGFEFLDLFVAELSH